MNENHSPLIRQIELNSHLAEGSRVCGHLYFFAEAEVYGTVEGNLSQESLESLTIGPMSWIQGTIDSEGPIIIAGRVNGIIKSRTLIRILHTARIEGRIEAPSIQIRPGSAVNGEICSSTSSGAVMLAAA